ncbi:DNA-formamidopyrimidine glycosylase [Candidatus Giovannonibacteria bacterium RIFCSPLOWO2_01_FULL_46_13]|uniref:DNA-formamidopyrimidine glycosylase n=1 Tax=Candidatus Giovannonibacteria bacterium RIFCSPLOWO2_01_FULL_46_13 TaxID=1798352 RepID=A0A1F5X498_9BACT|nr:MAG: DNA-formamidopyrimidine glycosylase [Candidatus Giovannonibacteria bacterium RIFCSPLOWO2_01_FULL_46_13]
MPELPEVEITKRKLGPLLIGKRILPARNAAHSAAGGNLGRKILGVERLGKAILIRLSGGKILAFHQRMSGKILVAEKDFDSKHVRFKYKLSSGKNLIFHDVRKFGVRWYGTAKKVLSDPYFLRLGLDPLEIDFKKFKELLGKLKGGIKAALLRQDILAGVGNIIADESLWKAKIHPQKRIENFSEADFKNLFAALRFILEKSIKLGGSTMRDWYHPDNTKGGYFAQRLIYGRANEKCKKCGKIIIRMKAAGRGTFICTKCQPFKQE